MQLQECLDEIIFGRKNRRAEHQYHEHLIRLMAAADQRMAEQTISRVLVVRFNLKGFQELADIADDRVRCLIFKQTLINLYDVVRSLLVNAGNDLSIAPVGKDSVYLVAVMRGSFIPVIACTGQSGFISFESCFCFQASCSAYVRCRN